ncbi:hypothetical protein [Lederbergia citrea]|uniref:hypothetical protein n=1 Tax=Lederbergia citrea TaxID=2833581 RepID=UPI001BC92C12|nr:hypothetical protein [Lederbergia citrea]MBS4177541.1 hypothetical protein [Lederbergia citrea]
MKVLTIIYSAILHGFLGYIWIIFISKLLDLFQLAGKSVWAGVLIGVGTLLFLDMTSRVFESFGKDKKHPARVAGYISFGVIVLGWLMIFKAK